MKETHKPFWETMRNPITGFKIYRHNNCAETYKASRKKSNKKSRENKKAQDHE